MANRMQVLCRLMIVTILFVVFIIAFFIPGIQKFFAKDTIFIEQKIPIDYSHPPAVTVLPWKGTLLSGFKGKTYTSTGDICEESNTYQNFVKCIEDNTFKQNMTIKGIMEKDDDEELDIPSWTEELTNAYIGKSFTLFNYQFGEEVKISLDPSLNYTVLIHDPNFYFPNLNPETLPSLVTTIDNSQVQLFWVKVSYHKLMNKKSRQCNSSPNYSFAMCTRESISAIVGCKMLWDPWSREKNNCTTVEQLLDFQKIYNKLGITATLQQLTNLTGCWPPCRFAQYELSGQPLKDRINSKRFVMKFSSFDASERTEVLLYPTESLFSELGGALGLLLGFSLIMVWDSIQSSLIYLISIFRKHFKK